jgi:opacity protein-like surface antigen
VRKFALSAVSILTLAAAAPAAAAPNPAGTGEPGVATTNGADCSQTSSSPNGFNSGGFTNTAGNVYANPGAQSGTSSGNGHAVSEYDIACFQVSQIH